MTDKQTERQRNRGGGAFGEIFGERKRQASRGKRMNEIPKRRGGGAERKLREKDF